jgi:MFS transporter, DHA2 family, multidrug resistance protein
MLYVGLDQGNRLDWFNSGLINSVFIAGGILFVLFLINEALVSRPWAHASVLRSRNVVLGLAAITVYTLASSSGSTLVPGFMQTVAAMRPYQIGSLFIFYAALPAFLFVSVAGLLLRYLDPRVVLILGMTATGIAALIGLQVTSDWFPPSFRFLTLLNTAGQVLTFFAAFVFIVANSDPKRSTSLSAYIQVFRLGSAEVAASFMQTFLRIREQFHSNSLGVHLVGDAAAVRLQVSALSHHFGGAGARAQALAALSSSARNQANVLAYSDAFLSAFWFAVGGLILVALMARAPEGPLSPRRLGLFRPRS